MTEFLLEIFIDCIFVILITLFATFYIPSSKKVYVYLHFTQCQNLFGLGAVFVNRFLLQLNQLKTLLYLNIIHVLFVLNSLVISVFSACEYFFTILLYSAHLHIRYTHLHCTTLHVTTIVVLLYSYGHNHYPIYNILTSDIIFLYFHVGVRLYFFHEGLIKSIEHSLYQL